MSTPSPPPFRGSIGRLSMSVHGDFVLLMDPESSLPSEAAFFRLDLNVRTRSPHPSGLLRNSTWYAPVQLPLNRLPELRRMIDGSAPTPDQSVISAGGGDDFMTILTDIVSTYIFDRMVYLDVMEQAPPGAPVEAMLTKVTYNPATQILESMCPICLEDFEDGQEVHLTPCRHPFHLRCLEFSLRYKALCPLCRGTLP